MVRKRALYLFLKNHKKQLRLIKFWERVNADSGFEEASARNTKASRFEGSVGFKRRRTISFYSPHRVLVEHTQDAVPHISDSQVCGPGLGPSGHEEHVSELSRVWSPFSRYSMG